MEVSESFHCQWKRKLPLLPIAASTHIFRGSFHELPYTPTYFHLPLRVLQTSSCFHKTSTRDHPLPFDLLILVLWKFPPNFMETSTEVKLLPFYSHGSQFTMKGFHGSPWKDIPWMETGSFHGSRRNISFFYGNFHRSSWK